MAFLIILLNYCFLNLLPLNTLVQVVPPQALELGGWRGAGVQVVVGASFLTNFKKFQTRKFMIKILHYRLLSSGNILRDVWLSISPPPPKKKVLRGIWVHYGPLVSFYSIWLYPSDFWIFLFLNKRLMWLLRTIMMKLLLVWIFIEDKYVWPDVLVKKLAVI